MRLEGFCLSSNDCISLSGAHLNNHRSRIEELSDIVNSIDGLAILSTHRQGKSIQARETESRSISLPLEKSRASSLSVNNTEREKHTPRVGRRNK